MKGIKIILWICAIGGLWGFIPAVLPWQAITAWMNWVGIQPPGDEAVTVYMFRLGFMAFGMMGVFFLILARNPLSYGAMLPFAAYWLICFGLVRLAGGIHYGLPFWNYFGDFIFCVVGGVLILIFQKKALKINRA